MKWERVELGEVCELVKTGKTPPSKKREYYDGEINWFTPGDFTRTKYLSKSNRTLTETAVKEKKATLFPQDTLLLTCIGEIGKSGIIKSPASSNQQITALKPKEHVCLDFLYYWTQFSKPILAEYANNAVVPILNNTQLKKIPFKYPPLPEQRRLAARLDKADAVRQKSRALVDVYAELGRSVFLEVFGDPVRNERGWEVVLLEDIIADGPTNGLYKPSKEYGSGNPIVRIDSFYNGPIELSKLKRVKATKNEVERYNLKNGDILINRVNSRSHLGKCGLVHGLKEDTVFESNMMRIRFDQSRAKNEYLMQILQHPYLKNQILNRCKDAVNQSSINQTDVKSLQIPLPPLDLQSRFAAMVANIEAQRRLAERQLEAAEAVFGGVLQGTFEK